MSCILYIETSTSVCSVAVSHEGHIIYDQLEKEGPRQATILAPVVRKPDILILDDSASALDYATDAALRKSIREMKDAPTLFVVS